MISDTLTLDTPKRRSGGVWDYISPSRLNCWLACPLKFRARYLDGIKTPTTPSLFLGKQVHAGLEHYYRHRQLSVMLSAEDVAKRIVDRWDKAVDEENMTFKSETDDMALKKQAVDLVAAYLAQVPADEPKPLGVEVTMEAPLVDPITGEDLGIPLLGVTDLIAGGDDGPTIVDFKTAARSAPPFEISHEIQLSSYSFLYRQIAGHSESGLEIRSLIKTKKPKIEVHDYPARDEVRFRRLFAVIREYLDALDRGRFNFRPGWSCGMCDFRDGSCRQWAG